MSLEIHADSHVDHNLTPEHITWLLERFADREAFFIETIALPTSLGLVDCALYGPAFGEGGAIPEEDVSYGIRGNRKYASRLIGRPVRKTRMLTVVAGPHDGKACVLFTAYGGPQAPREPGDPSLATWDQLEESRAFWKSHALAEG